VSVLLATNCPRWRRRGVVRRETEIESLISMSELLMVKAVWSKNRNDMQAVWTSDL